VLCCAGKSLAERRLITGILSVIIIKGGKQQAMSALWGKVAKSDRPVMTVTTSALLMSSDTSVISSCEVFI
jgi:hypothetical protein